MMLHGLLIPRWKQNTFRINAIVFNLLVEIVFAYSNEDNTMNMRIEERIRVAWHRIGKFEKNFFGI